MPDELDIQRDRDLVGDRQSIVASTVASAARLGSKCAMPLMPLNSPRTEEVIRWRTLKCYFEAM